MRNDATVIGLISFAHGMSHFFQLLLAPLFPFIKDELGVSYAALGFLVAVFYTISGVLQPLVGFVVDRYGARVAVVAAELLREVRLLEKLRCLVDRLEAQRLDEHVRRHRHHAAHRVAGAGVDQRDRRAVGVADQYGVFHSQALEKVW